MFQARISTDPTHDGWPSHRVGGLVLLLIGAVLVNPMASGLGAVSTVYLALLTAGDHMVSTDSVYGPSRGLMEKHMSRFGVESSYVDTSDLENLRKAMKPNTKLV